MSWIRFENQICFCSRFLRILSETCDNMALSKQQNNAESAPLIRAFANFFRPVSTLCRRIASICDKYSYFHRTINGYCTCFLDDEYRRFLLF